MKRKRGAKRAKFNPSVLAAALVIALPFLVTSPSVVDVAGPEEYELSEAYSAPDGLDEAADDAEATPTLTPAPTSTPTPTPTPTPSPTPAPTPTLIPLVNEHKPINKKSKPKAIKAIQQRLARLGYYEGAIDGEYSDSLKSAVSAFQRANSLLINEYAVSLSMQKLVNKSDNAVNALGEKGFLRSGGEVSPGASASTPEPSFTPEPVVEYVPVRLPMNDFSTGSKPLQSGFSSDYAYGDPSITVTVTREKIGRSVYVSADVVISDPSQLRAALGGTPKRPSTARMTKIAKRSGAVIAINGDFYTHRSRGYAVRQSTQLHKFAESSYDLLVIDAEGDFHIYLAKKAREGMAKFTGSVYQAYSFGPALIIDGEKQPTPKGYEFGPGYKNPRTAIGQIGPLHYLLLVVDGRTDYSLGVETEDLADYMYDHGCVQAYNLDGGGSSTMYFGGRVVNNMTYSGERSIPDIIYFASTASIESEAAK